MDNGNNGKPSSPGPRFNSYWIYAIIAVFLLALNFYTMSESSRDPIELTELKEMVGDHAIRKIVKITNQDIAYIYIKDDKLQEERYKDAAKSTFGGERYHYWMHIDDGFDRRLDQFQDEAKYTEDEWIYPSSEKRQDYLGNILSWLLPIVVVVAASRHRQAAFAAAEYLMDFLKSRAPFWKKEHRADGSDGGWVDAKETDEDALTRWD